MLSYTLFHLLVDPGLGVIIFSIVVDMVVSAVVVVWNQLRYNGKEMVRLHVVDVVVVVNDGSSLVSVKSSLPHEGGIPIPTDQHSPWTSCNTANGGCPIQTLLVEKRLVVMGRRDFSSSLWFRRVITLLNATTTMT